MADETGSKYPEILRDLVDKAGEMLVEEGIDRSKAQRLAWMLAELIRRDWGGQQIYLSKGLSYEISQRDLEIYREFDGSNHYYLAQKHNLTARQVYSVVARVRENELRRRQPALFSFANDEPS